MTCTCAFDQFLQALKGALCMPEFPCVAGGHAFSSVVNTGTSLPANCVTTASGGVKGDWAELIDSTPFDAGDLIIEIGTNGASRYQVDIGIGASGAESVLIADLACQTGASLGRSDTYRFRIPVPAGSRLSARAADSSGVLAPVYVKITFITPTALNGQFAGAVATYGAFSGSRGVNVDPGAVANTPSAWVEITAATVRAHQSLTVAATVGDFVLSGNAAWLVDIGIGGAGSEVVLIPSIFLGASASADISLGAVQAFDLNVPAGVRLSARAQCSSITNGDRDIYINLYGF